jgi:FkbM family methyltransferase
MLRTMRSWGLGLGQEQADVVWRVLRQAYRKLSPAVRGWIAPLRDVYVDSDIPNARRRLRAGIQPVAAQISQASALHKGERIVVDCGFNTGEVLQSFIDFLPKDFKYYGFEVNEPLFADAARGLLHRNPEIVSLQFQAVSDRDGEAEFFFSGTSHGLVIGEGTTIVQGKLPDVTQYDRPQKVRAIDFSNWVGQVARNHTSGRPPYVVIKMDIEGAECLVLEHMADMGTLNNISILIIEFHSNQFEGNLRQEYEMREDRLRGILADRGVQVIEWG